MSLLALNWKKKNCAKGKYDKALRRWRKHTRKKMGKKDKRKKKEIGRGEREIGRVKKEWSETVGSES